jgi:hypothetical protein
MKTHGKVITNARHNVSNAQNEQKTKEIECNSLNWDIKICLKNADVIRLFAGKSEEEVLTEMTNFIKRQSNKDTYVSYQKDNSDNLWYLWNRYPNQASIFFVYHLIGVCNPNIGLAIRSLKSNESGWSKNIKGMEDSKRNWNFMNKLIWKTNSLETYTMMYKALIDNEVDPWALNVEQEDAFGSFIFKLFKIDKIGDPDQELYFFNMLTTTSPSFIESKTQTILNKACQNFTVFESRIRYLYLSDPETFFTVLVKKLTSFKDLPRSCDEYSEVKSMFQIINQTMSDKFMAALPKMDFGDLCLSYDEVIRKKINKQKELKTVKDRAKAESDKGRKSKLWEKFNELTTEISEIKICWSDSIFHYLIRKTNSYPSLEMSLNLMINIIQTKINAIVTEYDEKTSNINILCWSLESLVAFLAELLAYDLHVNQILQLVSTIVLGEQVYSKLSTDVRFKIGLRFSAHAKDNSIIKLLNDLLPNTSGSIYKFMFNDLLDGLKVSVNVVPTDEKKVYPAINEIESFEHISYEDLMKVGLNDFLDDLTYDIELKLKNGFTEAQVCHRYVSDIINLECLTGTGEKMTFKEGHKRHIKTLVLNDRINKLLPRNSLKKAQQKIRLDFKGVEGMNDVRYIINNVGRALTDKIRTGKKN